MKRTANLLSSRGLSFAVIAAVVSLAALQGCGHQESGETAGGQKQVTGNATRASLDEKAQGVWFRACDPEGNPSSERLSLSVGFFVREVIFYSDGCQAETQRLTSRGTYSVGDAASNLKELAYDGDFSLRNAVGKTAWNIDFTIDEYVYVSKFPLEGASIREYESLREICPSLRLEADNTKISVSTKDCNLPNYRTHTFDILAIKGKELRLGVYIGDVDGFNSEGGSTVELRHNVLTAAPLVRVR